MRRAAGIALLVLGLAAGASRAGDDPPSTPAVSLAAWEERDVEGRWALYRSSEGPKPGDAGDPWVPFLAKRKKFQILEWISITSAAPAAVDALAKADAPGWVRCAVWSLSATDSHVGGGAEKWLTEKRPGLALAWFERFPAAAAEGPAKHVFSVLKAKDPKREDASALLPPLEPEAVFADLLPQAHVEDWGDRTQAEPGKAYVHQVERAIDALDYTRLEGEPWAGRLAALLAHPHPKVRRASALAYARRPRKEIPVGRLLAMADDEKELPEVRAAALLGASYSGHPAAYAKLLALAAIVGHPLWRAATSRLGDIDDGFAIGVWETLGPKLAGGERAFAEEQAGRIRARVAAGDDDAVPRMLERAAWVDLTRDPLGVTFVPWALKEIRGRLSAPEVRAAAEMARDGYEPLFFAAAPQGPGAPAIRERVRAYARDILAGGETPPGPR